MSSDFEARELTRFLACFAKDVAAGNERTLEEYVAQFPNCADAVRREHAALQGEGPETPALAGLERFRLLRVLGRGGQATVHLAEDLQLGRQVALKLLHGGWLPRRKLERLRREAKAASRTDHPGICTVYDTGAVGDTTWISMRYVSGETLASRIASGHRFLPDALLLFFEAAALALHAAHLAGVVHRDIKPANLMVTPELQPVVLDFGLASLAGSDEATLTLSGELMGTPSYMSPETIHGGKQPGPTADIYALGITMYEALTMQRPFDRATRDSTFAAIRDEPLPDPRRFDPRIPRDVRTVLETATEKEPARRYQSAADLAEDLRRVRERIPVRARPAGSLRRAVQWVRRHPVASMLSVVIGTSLAISSTAAWHAMQANVLAEQRRITAEREAYVAKIAGVALAVENGNPILGRSLLASAPSALWNWEARYLAARLDTTTTRIQSSRPWITAGFAASGSLVATVDQDGLAQTWSVPDGLLATTRSLAERLAGPAVFADDGRLLVGTGGTPGALRLLWFDADTGSLLRELEGSGKRASSLAVSPDGQTIAYSGDGTWVASAAGASAPTKVGRSNYAPLAFSHDGRRIALGLNGNSRTIGSGLVATWEVEPGRLVPQMHKLNPLRVDALALSEDGRLVLSGSPDKRVALHELATGNGVTEFRGHAGEVTAVAFAPGERRIASAATDLTVRVWEAQSGLCTAMLFGAGSRVDGLAFHGQDLLLARCGDAALVWDLHRTSDPTVLAGHGSFVYGVAYVAGGRRLVTGSWDGTLRAWDAQSGDDLGILQTGAQTILALAADDGAAWIASAHEMDIRIWDRDSGALLRTLAFEPAERVNALAVGDRGRLLAARSNGQVALWRMPAGELLVAWRSASSLEFMFNSVAFSPDARWLATDGPGNAITLWDLAKGRAPTRLQGIKHEVTRIVFDEAGRLLAAGTQGGEIRIWEVGTWVERAVIQAHPNAVWALTFTPDGTRLASGAHDATIRLWDLVACQQTILLSGHADYVFALQFSPDGAQLASASGDGTARIWDTTPRHIRVRAQVASNRQHADARTLLARLREEQTDPAAIAARLRSDASLGPELREAALRELLPR